MMSSFQRISTVALLAVLLSAGSNRAVLAQDSVTDLIEELSIWKFEATGTDLGTGWREASYNDASWDSGAGILGYGEAYITTTVPYGSNPSDKHRTTYFRLTFPVDVDPAKINQLQIHANFDDGFVAYLNGIEVTRQFMPGGTVSYTTQAYDHESGAYELIDVSSFIGDLTPGNNTLAVEVHQVSGASSDLAWDCRLAADTGQIQFMWSGAVTASSARVKAKLLSEGLVARLIVDDNPSFTSPVYSTPDTALIAENNRVVDLSVTGLNSSTQYYYALELDGTPQPDKIGEFETFPPPTGGSFTVALGSCAQTASSHAVFTTIRDHDPLLFLHMGDLHYQNISVADPDVFRAAYESVLNSTAQADLYLHVPIAYVWDDHDYGPNNSDSTAPGRSEARAVYQEYVPHYPLAAGSGDVPIYQTFSIGRVLFIVADSRSARSPASSVDNAGKTMLGTDQKAWFKQQLVDGDTLFPLIVWVNSLPWIGITGDDGWHLYTTERAELADFIAGNAIDGLCMVSGDAHMLAIDNGSHSDYAGGGGAGFPVMHAAALDRSGSVKGGPYSEGAFPGGGQFGLMTVTDTGGPLIHVEWSGRDWLDNELVSLSFSVLVTGGPICECACHADPNCDGLTDVVDVLDVIDVVFAGASQSVHPLCPNVQDDADCDGAVTVRDIVLLIDVAFRNAPATLICNPCQP